MQSNLEKEWNKNRSEEENIYLALLNLPKLIDINKKRKFLTKFFGVTMEIELNCIGSIDLIFASKQTILLVEMGEIKLSLSYFY